MNLEQLFENSFDCYADAEEDVEKKMAMTKGRFVEVVKALIDSFLLSVQCRYCGGDCPTNENNCCDGYNGDIDGLYSPTDQEPYSQ